jgi:thiamine-monophosphate kinase
MDLSDGLVGDLQHLLKASKVGATLHTAAALDLLAARKLTDWPSAGINDDAALTCVLSGGDDYELLFTAPPSAAAALQVASLQSATPIHCIGRINAAPGMQLLGSNGCELPNNFTSFDHFS